MARLIRALVLMENLYGESMYVVSRTGRFIRGFLMSYGPESIKKTVWDREFARGKWNFIDHTAGDCVYEFLEKYSGNGSILDLGCGPGNTATELKSDAYQSYVGVDISKEALFKAAKRSQEADRMAKNRFVRSDFLAYQPAEKYDVVLFRESMYHIQVGKIKPILDKYSQHLTGRGVFIVRMFLTQNGKVKARLMRMVDIIESNFEMLERYHHGSTGPSILVFRPKHMRSTIGVHAVS